MCAADSRKYPHLLNGICYKHQNSFPTKSVLIHSPVLCMVLIMEYMNYNFTINLILKVKTVAKTGQTRIFPAIYRTRNPKTFYMQNEPILLDEYGTEQVMRNFGDYRVVPTIGSGLLAKTL